MKQFWGFVMKEVRHIMRDYRTLVILIGMPVIQLLLFGFAIRNEVTNADIAILDASKDYMTTEITNKLLSSGYFHLSAELANASDIEGVFRSGKAKQVVVFSQNFARDLYKNGTASVQIIGDASNPNMATILFGYTTSIIQDYQFQLAAHRGQNAVLPITPEIKMLYNPELKSVYGFVTGLVGMILLLVSALMTSIAITREKELGTMEVLLVSPLKPPQIILGKVLPYLVLSIINAVTVLLMAQFVFNIPFRGSYGLFFFEIMLYILTALSLGIFISTKAKTQQVAMMISLGALLMPTILLSGFIFPVENMPLPLQIISNVIPARWFLVTLKAIMLEGLGFEYFWKETAVLSGMAIVLIALSMKNFKVRL